MCKINPTSMIKQLRPVLCIHFHNTMTTVAITSSFVLHEAIYEWCTCTAQVKEVC